MIDLFTLGRSAVFRLDPETAHGMSINALKTGLVPACTVDDSRLKTTVAGLSFPNPLGMAAGYDKNAEVPDALLKLGYGFVEVGTVTPKPQGGNPKPRIFRLVKDEAIINRLGFNNEGHDAAYARLSRRARRGILGVNIGANKDSADRMADYRLGVARFADLASYITVNISSPNTPGLRGLQDPEALAQLLDVVCEERARQSAKPPIFLKIAPDLDDLALDAIADAVLKSGIEGLIVSNTTIARPRLSDHQSKETGGLSGRPLFVPSTVMLAKMRSRVGPALALIGAGGVETAETALQKIRAGADLVQIYTGMIYGGPGLPSRILSGLSDHATRLGVTQLSQLRDSGTEEWAKRTI
ncbi:quinone-dependent dihydroorotate dehydrogenase [Tianweitania sp. BSSL-BM11]|uniref:Dihydroorotate dehydrogenase (quinone) n=1 Tax=Tianweitania aestuarii TaxID=2814886 RepID=A0ABS5RU80_9HYPH|nr:quinone-dependent dihydroorotate dehydrogenase [Tianweitania aestuarii]MBS9719277.1 quinone-dependent dihydroorotate dehydrogenase [Tianweitania aestuarii]